MEVSYYPGCSLHGMAAEYDESIQAVCGTLGIALAELDDWTDKHVIDPMRAAWEEYDNAPDDASEDVCRGALLDKLGAVRSAIREKVLESYRNGQKAGPYKTKIRAPGAVGSGSP